MDRSTQTSSYLAPPQGGPPTAEAHLFSHLPLHSQQPARSPYSMVPVGGIQLVPAGLATFVPIQAGPVQLTIPAVGVIHQNAGPLPPPSSLSQQDAPEPLGSVLPCFPLQPVGLETLNLVGLTPQGLTLNAAVGLQVLAASPPSPSGPQVPGLQIVNIALPALIPSLSPAPEAPGGRTPQTPCGSLAPELEGQGQTNGPGEPAPQPTPNPGSWQTPVDVNEASSDDEDRLVIAT